MTVRVMARFFVLACALALCQPHETWAQARAAASAVPLADLDGSIEALVRAVDPTVVQIFTTGLTPAEGIVAGQSELVTTQRASGSGVVVDADGYVVTNAHVVRGASRIRVEIPVQPAGQSLLTRRSRVINAKLVGLDDETDLAVLKIEATGLRVLPFGDSDALKAGQMALAFGSPLGLQNSVSLGIVSAIARQLEPDSPMVYVQTDASINPGNSGGPLVDSQGRLIGVNTLILSASGSNSNSGLGFAAPSNIVRTVFDQIKKNGRVRRGDIGVRAQTITPVLAAGGLLLIGLGILMLLNPQGHHSWAWRLLVYVPRSTVGIIAIAAGVAGIVLGAWEWRDPQAFGAFAADLPRKIRLLY